MYFYLYFEIVLICHFQLANLKKQANSKKLWVVVLVFVLIIVGLVAEALYLHYKHQGEVHVLGNLYLEKEHRRVRVYPTPEQEGIPLLETRVGYGWPEGSSNKHHLKALPCFNPANRKVRGKSGLWTGVLCSSYIVGSSTRFG